MLLFGFTSNRHSIIDPIVCQLHLSSHQTIKLVNCDHFLRNIAWICCFCCWRFSISHFLLLPRFFVSSLSDLPDFFKHLSSSLLGYCSTFIFFTNGNTYICLLVFMSYSFLKILQYVNVKKQGFYMIFMQITLIFTWWVDERICMKLSMDMRHDMWLSKDQTKINLRIFLIVKFTNGERRIGNMYVAQPWSSQWKQSPWLLTSVQRNYLDCRQSTNMPDILFARQISSLDLSSPFLPTTHVTIPVAIIDSPYHWESSAKSCSTVLSRLCSSIYRVASFITWSQRII